MAHRAGQKEESRAKILRSAGRGFRSSGFGGTGVDGMAKDAGVTSGAFYAHFKSKNDAFREAVIDGLDEFTQAVKQLQDQLGERWRTALIDFYLGERRTCKPEETCALQSMSSDVARADDKVKKAYEGEFKQLVDAVAAGLHGSAKAKREEAVALLALLAGGVTLARAVNDSEYSKEIATAVRKAALQLANQ